MYTARFSIHSFIPACIIYSPNVYWTFVEPDARLGSRDVRRNSPFLPCRAHISVWIAGGKEGEGAGGATYV